jgi:pSer/pThr/pTyr-binding forkhead associated (FHA) protein
MEVRLKVLAGKVRGQELMVPGPKFFIGRAEDCQLRPRSDLISRHHCALLIEENFVAVRDFGSKNGTHVNGERVLGERELKSGDKLTIGPLEFEICLLTTTSSKKRPKVESIKEAATRTAESSEERVDVSQWLTDRDQRDGVAETRVVNVNETSEIDVGESHGRRQGVGKRPRKRRRQGGIIGDFDQEAARKESAGQAAGHGRQGQFGRQPVCRRRRAQQVL